MFNEAIKIENKKEVIVCGICGKTIEVDQDECFCPECGALIADIVDDDTLSRGTKIDGNDQVDGIEFLGDKVEDFIIIGNKKDDDDDEEEDGDGQKEKTLAPVVRMISSR